MSLLRSRSVSTTPGTCAGCQSVCAAVVESGCWRNSHPSLSDMLLRCALAIGANPIKATANQSNASNRTRANTMNALLHQNVLLTCGRSIYNHSGGNTFWHEESRQLVRKWE